MDIAPPPERRRCLLLPEAVLRGGPTPSLETGDAVLVEGDEITAVGPRAALEDKLGADGPWSALELPGRVLVPGGVNVHNHSFQSLLRGIADDLPFLEWRDRALYRWAPRLGRAGVEAGAMLAFGEMLRAGVTTVCDFFYVHDGGNDNAIAVIGAARRLGIRMVMARCFYDWDGAPASFRETPAEAERRFDELAAAAVGDRGVLVCPAPHSLHGASADMITRGAAVARRHGVPMHIHIAEEKWQVDQARERYGTTPLRALDGLGALGDATVIVHGCWLDAGERELLAERRGRLAYCPASNMFLGDGVTDIPDLLARGVRVGLGTDGGCSNSRVSVFDEMRSCALLQKVHRLDGQALSAEAAFAMGTAGGGDVLGLPVGRIAAGQRADLVALDLDHLSLQPGARDGQRLQKNIVYAMDAGAVTDVFVGGRQVVQARELVTVAEGEIRARAHEVFAA